MMCPRLRHTALAVCALLTLATPTPAPASPQQVLSPSPSFATGSPPTLYDILTLDRQSSIFFDYIRSSSPSLSTLLLSPTSHTTLFVPLNSAIMALSHRPHMGAPVSKVEGGVLESSREEEEGRQKYLQEWVERHVVKGRVEMPGEEGWEGKEWETVQGGVVGFEKRGDEVVVVPGRVEVSHLQEGGNGRIVFLNGVLSLED